MGYRTYRRILGVVCYARHMNDFQADPSRNEILRCTSHPSICSKEPQTNTSSHHSELHFSSLRICITFLRGFTMLSLTDDRTLVHDLEQFCSSSLLTLTELKTKMDIIPRRCLNDSNFFHRVCSNEVVTNEIITYLFDEFACALYKKANIPELDCIALPLHFACWNRSCPNSAIECLLSNNNDAARFMLCAEANGARDRALPLHLYLLRTKNTNVDIVKRLAECNPGSLLSGPEPAIFTVLDNPNIGNMLDILKYIVNTEPSAIDKTVKEGMSPLSVACANPHVTFDVIQYLLEVGPFLALKEGRMGRLPLYELCRSNGHTSLELVKLVTDAYPEAVTQVGSGGRIPIHAAVLKKSLEIVKYLANKNLRSLEMTDNEGSLPFHLACGYGNIETVKYLSEMHPLSTEATLNDGRTALHMACYNSNSLIVEHVYLLRPGAMNVSSNRGRRPIHEAVCESLTGAVKVLLVLDPDCASSRDGQRLLPLQNAFKAGNKEIADMLFDTYPEALLARERYNRSSLDLLRANLKPCQMLKSPGASKILSSFTVHELWAQMTEDQHALATLDSNGWLPLHHALSQGCPLGTIKLFVKSYPQALSVSVLEIACKSCSVSVVKYLADQLIGWRNLCDSKGNYLLHHACMSGNIDVVNYMLEENVSVLTHSNCDGKIPISLFNEFVRSNGCAKDQTKYVDTIWRLISANPESIRYYMEGDDA